MRNKINRISNRETANIFKAVDAAIQQRKAIEILEKKGIAESLEPELVSAIKLRKENPEASLTELCRISSEPITRSGLNHRFRRILEIAQEKNKD
jgi:DNA-binding protein WhiA